VRLFVALVPPPEAVAHLAAAVAPARERHPGLRWTAPERWHLTLAFLGEVEDRLLPGLGERLQRAARRHGPPALSLAGAGRFGAQVLWVGVHGETDAVTRLAASAAAAGRRVGLRTADGPGQRPYRPHLTVARAREPVDLAAAVADLAGYAGPGWTAPALALVRSHLGPAPRHETLLTAPLGA
jgi:2'-5' RNA ligase